MDDNLNLGNFKNDCQCMLLNLLNKHAGNKTIVWDDKLIGPFEFVASTSVLKKHNVVQMYRLSTVKFHIQMSDCDHVIFLIRKEYPTLRLISDILIQSDASFLRKTSLIFVPRNCESSIMFLKSRKVPIDQLYKVDELPVNLFVLDTDLMSMENGNAFRQINLDKDYSCVKDAIDSIEKIEQLYGTIAKISGQGECAEIILKQIKKKRRMTDTSSTNPSLKIPSSIPPVVPKIHHLLLLDRNIDLLTPLLTQLTYEGILDEVFGITHGCVVLPDKKTSRLNSNEELFAKLRDIHINAVAQTLKQTARKLQAEFDDSQSKVKTVHEMRKVVQRIPYLKKAKESHANHLKIAEYISKRTSENDFIYGLRIEHEFLQEGRIGRVMPEIDLKLMRQENPIHLLRLICAHSLSSNGLKQKVSEHYKRELIQNAGYEYMSILDDLKAVNVFIDQERDGDLFSQIRDKYNLVTENVEEINPNHPSYVYGGYLPFTIYLAKLLARSSSPRLPEPAFNYVDTHVFNPANQSHEEQRTVLVYFIGGCTFSEISALRFLSQQEENNCDFLIATTNICNGNTFMQSFMTSILDVD